MIQRYQDNVRFQIFRMIVENNLLYCISLLKEDVFSNSEFNISKGLNMLWKF